MTRCLAIYAYSGLLLNLGLLFSGAAVAVAPPVALVAQYPADLTPAAAKAIPDMEPQVTQQVRQLLRQYAQGSLPEADFTEKARSLLPPKAIQENGLKIASYGQLEQLQLLSRKVDGEDRNYRYRAAYSKANLLVDINFNKAGKVAYLQLIPE